MTSRTRVRAARPQDVAAILALVRELADYEREPDAVEADENDFRTALFGPDPRVHAFVAEVLPADLPRELPADAAAPCWDSDAEIAGIAVWFVSFSTWRGRHGIWLEDLFVRPAFRGLGLGRALLAELAAECNRRGYPRLEWNVLDWNESALAFYRRIGAEPLDEWTVHRLTGPALQKLALQNLALQNLALQNLALQNLALQNLTQQPDDGTSEPPGLSPAPDRR